MKKKYFILSLAAGILLISAIYAGSGYLETVPQLDLNKPIYIAELLERKHIMGSTEERDELFTRFDNLSNDISKNAKDYLSRLQLAEIYMSEARISGEHGYYYPAALKLLDDVLAETPQDKDIHFRSLTMKASVYLSLHKFKEALEIGEKAYKMNNQNAHICGVLVDANVELGNYQKAVEMADKMVSIRPDLRSYSRVSYLREIFGQTDGAIEAMDMAVSAGLPGLEQTAWARLVLGNLIENKGDITNAEYHYKIILLERENYVFAMAAIANIETKKKNYKEAENLLNNAIKVMPEVGFYMQLADVFMVTGRKEDAKKTAKEILEMLKEDQESGHVMGLEYAKVYLEYFNDIEKAWDFCKKEIAQRPDNIDVNKQAAVIFYKKGDYKEAERCILKALSTNSENAELLGIAGLIFKKSGNEKDSREYIRKSVQMNPYQNHFLAHEVLSSFKKKA